MGVGVESEVVEEGEGEEVSSRSIGVDLRYEVLVGVFRSSPPVSSVSSLISSSADSESSSCGLTRPAESRPFFLRSSERFEILTL